MAPMTVYGMYGLFAKTFPNPSPQALATCTSSTRGLRLKAQGSGSMGFRV